MPQGGTCQKVCQRAETADRKTFPLGLLHRLEVGLGVWLKRHDVTDAPKIFNVEPCPASTNSFHESAAHYLDVSTNKRLKIGCARVEENQKHIQPFVFEETFIFSDVNRQKGHVHRRKSDDELRLTRLR